MPCELIGWGEVQRLTRRLATRIRAAGVRPDIIVAIGRGGWVPGRLLSDLLDVMNLTEFKIEHYRAAERSRRAEVRYPLNAPIDGLHLLLVDDVSDSGDTFDTALAHLASRGRPASLHTVVLHHKQTASMVPDFYGRKLLKWRWLIYPWAMVEDLSGFTARMRPPPRGREALRRWLHEEYGIRPSAAMLDAVLELRAQASPPPPRA